MCIANRQQKGAFALYGQFKDHGNVFGVSVSSLLAYKPSNGKFVCIEAKSRISRGRLNITCVIDVYAPGLALTIFYAFL